MKSLLLQLNQTPSPHLRRASLSVLLTLCLCVGARGQVDSGSTGADGAFNPTVSTNINMADHPDGIYHYTSVNIPGDVTVTFTPNANNTPVVWLVQTSCVILGRVDVSAESAIGTIGGRGGPGGYRGGSGGTVPSSGYGPGGGGAGATQNGSGGSFGSRGSDHGGPLGNGPGNTYGNQFLVPLLGGSGGGAGDGSGGGGGGGAILIAATAQVQLNGTIIAGGGYGGDIPYPYNTRFGNGGSGGGIRVVTLNFSGNGNLFADGGGNSRGGGGGGAGRIRIDALQNSFGGNITGVFSQGFQPVVFPIAGQGIQLSVASIVGVPVAVSPAGQLITPDAIIPGQQANPVAIVVRCTNLPLNTPVTVTVKPANGAAISAVGYNTAGTLASSTATVQLNIPRGGGLIYATATTAN